MSLKFGFQTFNQLITHKFTPEKFTMIVEGDFGILDWPGLSSALDFTTAL